MTDREYPRWIHAPGTVPGKNSKLVNNAEEEAAQVAAWAAENGDPAPVNALTQPVEPPHLPQLDHDGDGNPGGSKRGGWPKGKPRKPATE